jgi:PAS domain S-box-containing protein
MNKIDEDISLVLDNLPVGIIRLDPAGNCIYANRYIMIALGVTQFDDVISKKHHNTHQDDLESENAMCQKFLFEHIESQTVFRLHNEHHKEYRWMTNKRVVIHSSEDNTVSFMYTLQDVHANKLMEIQLRNETLKVEEAFNHKSIFLANMSHEIRTPLNGIIGMLTLLEDTSLTTDQQDYINMVKECSFNLMTIINDILDFSKLEVGKISIDKKPMSLQKCVESTNDIVLSKIYEKSLEYSYNIGFDLPNFIISDNNRLKQILLNVLSNAIKFTDKGNIYLNVERITHSDYELLSNIYQTKIKPMESCQDKDDLYIRFDITDTGCGIPNEERDKLFKSFSQVTNLTSKIYQGTGLGLAISKELVELMDGFIWLDWSEPSRGTRFSFVIRTSIAEDDNMCHDNNNCDFVLQNANVLIVDDNLYNRISLTGMVSKWGMKPYAFSNGEEALYFSKITRFDIGLIDMCMPKMDGRNFALKLREQKEFNNQSFPLIALSSVGDKLSSKLFKSQLMKPIKETRLKQICVENLKNNYKNSVQKPTEDAGELDNYIIKNDFPALKENIRILLAEDVYINQRVIVSFLKKMGFPNVDIVENGEQCLNYTFNNDYDIILLDIRMPIYNGEVVLAKIQEHYKSNSHRRIPYIIAVTAYCLKEDRDKYLSMGFDDYIPKPVSYSDLTKCMDSFIKELLNE